LIKKIDYSKFQSTKQEQNKDSDKLHPGVPASSDQGKWLNYNTSPNSIFKIDSKLKISDPSYLDVPKENSRNTRSGSVLRDAPSKPLGPNLYEIFDMVPNSSHPKYQNGKAKQVDWWCLTSRASEQTAIQTT